MTKASNQFPYPYNLVFASMCGSISEEELPPDIEESVEYVLEYLMDQQESFMLVLRYMRNMTYREIGCYYGLTVQQSRQIIEKALRKLSHPLRFRCLRYGIAQVCPLPMKRWDCLPLGMVLHPKPLRDLGGSIKKRRQLQLSYSEGAEEKPRLMLDGHEVQAGSPIKVLLPGRWETVTVDIRPDVTGPERWYISTPGFSRINPIGLFVEIQQA